MRYLQFSVKRAIGVDQVVVMHTSSGAARAALEEPTFAYKIAYKIADSSKTVLSSVKSGQRREGADLKHTTKHATTQRPLFCISLMGAATS